MRGAVLLTGVLQAAASGLVTAPAPARAEADVAGDRTAHETVVQGRPEGAPRVDTDDLHDGPEVLLTVPGVALARDGGPLSPTRPLLRGLGGARLGVDVAGVAFADPTSGEVDVALLPWGLGAAVVDVAGEVDGGTLGGRLSLRPAPGDRLQLTIGELQTLQGSARLTVPVVGGRVTGAVSAGTTRGDFPFVVVDAANRPADALVRDNNDQRRLAAAVVADVGGAAPGGTGGDGGALSTHVVATGALHEGGVPGFATAPLALRAERARGALGATLGWRRGPHRVGVAVDALGDRRRVQDGPRVDEVVAGGGGVGLDLGTRLADDGARVIDGDVTTRGAVVVVPGLAVRQEGQARLGLRARAPTGDDTVFGLDGGVGLGIVADDDGVTVAGVGARRGTHVLPVGHLGARLAVDDARVALTLRHAARAPTLDERFAPAGFIRGTPDLAPERVTDLELRGGIDLDDIRPVSVDVAAFASRLEDGIVLVNKNAFEVAPQNTGPALRAGLELGLRARPLALVVVEQAATLLWSHVEATGAPLPTAPPLALRSRARLGTDDAWVAGTVTGRGSAPSTIFGTLGSGAFVLLDLAARLPLGDRLALTLAVDNALDVRHARDQNLLPLPGRLASVGLEVRP